MDPRQRWQALQAHLTTARACLDERNFAAALAAVDAALTIDPDFLAAQSLRDRIVAMAPNLSIAQSYGPPALPRQTPTPQTLVAAAPTARPCIGESPSPADDTIIRAAVVDTPPVTTPLIDDLPLVVQSDAVAQSSSPIEVVESTPVSNSSSPMDAVQSTAVAQPASPIAPPTSTTAQTPRPFAAPWSVAAQTPRPVAAPSSAVTQSPNAVPQPASRVPSSSKVVRLSSPVAPTTSPIAPVSSPIAAGDGFARFEQRAKRRRVDRRLDAARAALAAGRLKEAASALDEVVELDPNVPELCELTVQYAHLRQNVARPHAGRWLVAAAAFGGIVLGASWLQDATGLLWSRQMAGMSALVVPPEPFAVSVPASEAEPESAVAMATIAPSAAPFEPVRPAPPAAAVPAVSERTGPPPRETFAVGPEPESRSLLERPAVTQAVLSPPSSQPLSPLSQPVSPPQSPRPAEEPSTMASLGRAVPLAAGSPAGASSMLPPSPAPATAAVIKTLDDEALIKQVLQRYRSAYEGLDARSAHAVWPAVNQTALARAFDGLASQSLTFEACDVRMHGDAAAATCRGSARYVPKIGSHEPRVEPRTWNFTLKRNGIDWTIESARTAR